MGFFSSKEKSEINDPNNMSPLEAVTHLFASIQIADQQASYEEKESWINAITKLFPEHQRIEQRNFSQRLMMFLQLKTQKNEVSISLQF